MTTVADRFMTALLPAQLPDDPEEVRKARMAVAFSLVILVAGAAYGAVYGLLGLVLPSAGALVASVLGALSIVAFRRHRSARLAGHFLGFITVLALALVTAGTGGIQSPANAWYVLAALIPGMLAGRWASLPWSGVAAAWMGLEYAVYLQAGHVFPAPGVSVVMFFLWAVPLGLLVAVGAIAWAYELAREQASARIAEMGGALEDAHSSARQILDTIGEGLLLVTPEGRLETEHSAEVERLLGAVPSGSTLWSLFEPHDPGFASWLALSWEDLASGWMPMEVIVAQLPSAVVVGERHLALSYTPIGDEEDLERVLVRVRDVTHQVQMEAEAAAQRELLSVFLGMLHDREGVTAFLDEASELVDRVRRGDGSPEQDRRWLHTLKGNCATFGLATLAHWVHDLEDRVEEQGGLEPDDRAGVAERWKETMDHLGTVLGQDKGDVIAVDRQALEATVALAEGGAPSTELALRMRRWTWRRVDLQLDKLAERTRNIAAGIGKSHVDVRIDAEDLRVPPSRQWSSLFSVLVHVVRNAVDHGVEWAEERVEQGKSERAEVCLSAFAAAGRIVVEVADDGRGIDWATLRARGQRAGLPVDTDDDLIAVMFHDGVSTRDEVSETSGRGVGTAAVLEVVQELGGTVEVVSKPGAGTTFRFSFPRPTVALRMAS